MKNKEIIKELDLLDNLLSKEQYKQAQNEIKKIKNKIEANDNVAAEYIDGLVEELR